MIFRRKDGGPSMSGDKNIEQKMNRSGAWNYV